MTDILLSQVEGRIATLTLNRPEKLNAINYALADRIIEALDSLEIDRSIDGIIITGAGDRAFSAGGDIHEFSDTAKLGATQAQRDFVCRGQAMTRRIEAFTKPIVVAVNGLAYGGGCEITEAAPLAIASDQAVFSKPEIKLAMPPTFGGTQRLPRVAGRKRAMELLLTGETFSADRAVELGLVNHVVAADDLITAAQDLLDRILVHSPLAVARIMTAVTRGLNMSIDEGLLVESEQYARMVPTRDYREGLEAWIARRPATYQGE